jgi:hypothetical protein
VYVSALFNTLRLINGLFWGFVIQSEESNKHSLAVSCICCHSHVGGNPKALKKINQFEIAQHCKLKIKAIILTVSEVLK